METTFVFKILSLGSLCHLLPDEKTYLCRPCVALENEPKKWGNEYILMPRKFFEDYQNNPKSNLFLGAFGKDNKGHINIKILKHYDAPVRPDYFIDVVRHTGIRVHKIYDFKKARMESYSKIFSAAYHLKGDQYVCETMLVLQHGDEAVVGTKYIFDAKKEKLERVSSL